MAMLLLLKHGCKVFDRLDIPLKPHHPRVPIARRGAPAAQPGRVIPAA